MDSATRKAKLEELKANQFNQAMTGIPLRYKGSTRTEIVWRIPLDYLIYNKYASSTNPVIDSHSIILTLNEWCWYWILLDSTLILLLVGIAFLVIKWSWTNLVLLLVALIVLSVIRWLIKRQTIKYTRLEIAEIWRSEERQKEIINALQDK